MVEGDLALLLARLIKCDVRFVIIGGYAVMAHGASMTTVDLDICAPLHYENAKRIGEALKDVRPRYRPHPKFIPLNVTPEFCQHLKNLYLRTDIGDIDILGEVPHFGDYAKVEQSSVLLELPIGPCRVINIDSLIAIKTAVGRKRDRDAVILLNAIREQNQLDKGSA